MAKTERHSMGREAAIALAETKWWEGKTAREICDLQLFTVELVMPFDRFHEAVEECLGRGVYTHEFGLDYDGIVAEYLGEKSPPTLNEIINLIPAEKRVVVAL